MHFFYLFLALGSDTSDAFDTNLCWALRFEVEHTLANLVFPTFRGRGCVCDSVADSKCCQTVQQLFPW